MQLNELLERLDMDSPEDFCYFEHFSDLVESNEFIEYDAFYMVLSETSPEILSELSESYFEEILANLPDNIVDIYTLMISIQKCLVGLASSAQTNDAHRLFVDELYKFHNWYALDGIVHCVRKKDHLMIDVPICEALALCRLEKLNEDSYEYDFSDCLDYELDSYSISLSSIIKSNYEADAPCTSGLVDKENPVIDGEYGDDEEV